VTDDQNWRAPEGPAAPPPGYSGYGPGYQYSPQAGWAPPPTGWTPPPKPGLIPLRPLTFGTLIGAPFQVLRRNPKVTVGSALLIVGIPRIVGQLLFLGALSFLISRVFLGTSSNQPALIAGAVGGTLLLGLVDFAITIISDAALQGIIVSEVARGTLGERLTARSLWRMCKGRVPALVGWSLIVFAAVIVAGVVLASIVFLLGLIHGAGVVLAILVGLFGLLGLFALAIWLNTKLSLVPSALVLEKLTIRAAVRRSWTLTGGFFWRTFGVIFLVGAIVFGVSEIIAIPVGLVGGFVTTLTNPTSLGTESAASTSQLLLGQLGLQAITSVVTLLVTAILSVVQASAVALIYLDLRMRKDGLDLKLVRFVEARQAGRTDIPDPYLPDAPVPSFSGQYPPGWGVAGQDPPGSSLPGQYPPGSSFPGQYPPGPNPPQSPPPVPPPWQGGNPPTT
jgi:hypothetical protein